MTGSRAHVSRRIYSAALEDAIDWCQSVLASHDADTGAGISRNCCEPGGRCEDYLTVRRRLADYRQARIGLTR